MQPYKLIAFCKLLSLFFPVATFAQKLSVQPIIGFNYVFNQAKKVHPEALTQIEYYPKKTAPIYGLDLSYISKKKAGISIGITYSNNRYLLKGRKYEGVQSFWDVSDYNVLFPIKALYDLPLNSGERSITFSAGVNLGFNKYNNQSIKMGTSATVYDTLNLHTLYGVPQKDYTFLKPQIGFNIGIELQPFKRFSGFKLGIDYSAQFLRTAEIYYISATYNPDIPTINIVDGNPIYLSQSALSFRVIYDLSFKKSAKSKKWNFINKPHEIDSTYYIKNQPTLVVPKQAISPYLELMAGWGSSIINKNKSISTQNMKFSPNDVSYGIGVGVHYMMSKNIGVGLGFQYNMTRFSVATKRSESKHLLYTNFIWKTTMSQYLFPLHFVYRHYYQANYKHIEYRPSLYLGFNQYFVFEYGGGAYHDPTRFIPYSSSFTSNFNFDYSFAAGLSNSFLLHPFAKNIGLKFGINYQIDFTRFNPVSYESEILFDNGMEEKYKATIAPLLSKLHFVVSYSPTFGLKGKRK